MASPERIEDAAFVRALDLVADGDVERLRAHLASQPDLVHRRVPFEGYAYFTEPTLLEFVAENPIRRNTLPPNIAEIARLILEAGAKANHAAIDSTLGLVCSGQVSREHGVQIALVDLLCGYGADPNLAVLSALAHGEFAAVDGLLRHGATVDLVMAAAMGRVEEARRTLPASDEAQRQRALSLAAQHGHAGIVRLLLDAGADPNRWNLPGLHAHSTPLHQAALAGHEDVVRLLVERGARRDLEDKLFKATPSGWAAHGGHPELAAYLAGA